MNSIAAVRGISGTTPAFRAKLFQIGTELGINPDFIATVISLESGFNAQARNPDGGAVGLIQFMPSTATRLGTSSATLFAMTAEQQLDYVRKFYQPWAGRLKTAGHAYMATFLPSFVGTPPGTIVAAQGSDEKISSGSQITKGQVYASNSGFDANKDGKILAGEVYAAAENRLAAAGGNRIDASAVSSSGSDLLLLGLALGSVYAVHRFL